MNGTYGVTPLGTTEAVDVRTAIWDIHDPRGWTRFDVALERCISQTQAVAEGIRELPGQESEPGAWWCADPLGNSSMHCRTPRVAFCRLWESINGAGSWADNPWVWVVEFKRVEVPAT